MSKLAEAPSPVPLPSLIHGSRFRAALRVLWRLVADVRGELTRLLRVVRSPQLRRTLRRESLDQMAEDGSWGKLPRLLAQSRGRQ